MTASIVLVIASINTCLVALQVFIVLNIYLIVYWPHDVLLQM